MRIISGSCRGRKLLPLKGWQIRPTSDRTREAVFNILGPKIRNANVLDLFAGTGALGIEALSRGAAHAVFVDIQCDMVKKNLALCRFEKSATLISCDITSKILVSKIPDLMFDVIFADPPYQEGLLDQLFQQHFLTRILSDNGVIIAEHSKKENVAVQHPGLDISRQKKYSKTIISFISKNLDKDMA